MTSHGSSSTSLHMKSLPSLPPGSLDVLETTEIDIASPLVERKPPSAKPFSSTDTVDIFILLCSLLLTTTSIVFVAFVLNFQANQRKFYLLDSLSFFQRVISSLSMTFTSAVIMVAGKRYALFKLTRGGLRSRRVVVYSNPSISALFSYFILHGAEFPLLGLAAVWVLGLVASLTVGNSWQAKDGPKSESIDFILPSGPLNAIPQGSSSWVTLASALLGNVEWSACLGLGWWNDAGLINITTAGITTDHPSAIIYYPAPTPWTPNFDFSLQTTMNGFSFSMENLSSVPTTVQSLKCESSDINLWFGGSDNQTLSIIAAQSPSTGNLRGSTDIFRFNATAIVMGGTLSYTVGYREFSWNGTSWPNVMSKDSWWAQDIASLICSATIPPIHDSSCAIAQTVPFIDFAATLNNKPSLDEVTFYSALSMALGAYSSVIYAQIGESTKVSGIQLYEFEFTIQYGFYILVLHIIASLITLVIVVRLRLASPLGADFTNSTRLLLDPLKKPELFNASLKTTLDALEDPYMVVRGNELLITEQKATRERKGWFSLCNFKLSGRASA